MLDSSWNSAAYQRFCGEVGILQNGEGGKWLLYAIASGEPLPLVPLFDSRQAAEEARKAIYDGWVQR